MGIIAVRREIQVNTEKLICRAEKLKAVKGCAGAETKQNEIV